VVPLISTDEKGNGVLFTLDLMDPEITPAFIVT
jgi:hypothetical protein